jgi:hypothetical protein
MTDKQPDYLVTLSIKQLAIGIVTALSIILGSGFATVKIVFDTAVEKETKAVMADSIIKYEKQVAELRDELSRLKLASSSSTEKVAEIIDSKTFLLIHSQYIISHSTYAEAPTNENLKYLQHIQNEYKRYLKHKELEIKNQPQGQFQFYSNQVRVIDGIMFHIPKDIVIGVQ